MRAYWLERDEGEALWMFDSLDTIKADAASTGGGFSLVEFLDAAGSTVPLHANDRWDRGFYVLSGDYTFVVGDDTVTASSGTWVFCPRGTPLAWRCHSHEGRVLDITVPGGIERFYREAGERVTDRTNLPAITEPDPRALMGTAARHGLTILGPPPAAE